MKTYIVYIPYSSNIGTVQGIYTKDTPPEVKENYIDVGSDFQLPKPNKLTEDLNPVMRVDLSNDTIFYDYISESTLESKVNDLQTENKSLNTELGNLLMQSAIDNATITELGDMVGNLLFEVAAMKGGAE